MRMHNPLRMRTLAAGTLLLATISLAQQTRSTMPPELTEGLQLLRAGQASEAKVKLDAAVKAAPRSADALTWRGICENQLQQYASAAADFQAAIRLDKNMLAAHYNLALSLIRLQKTDAAIEQLQFVIAAQPSAVQPLYNLAILLEAKGSFAEAVKRLQAAHAVAPADTGVTLHLLIDSLKSNQTQDLQPLLTALAANSTPTEVERQAAAALLEAGKYADAVKLLTAAHHREPDSAEDTLLLARALIGNGQDGEAITLLEGLTPASESADQHYLLGVAYLDTGAITKATQNFEASVRLDPKDARSLYQLGLIAEATPQGQTEAAQLLASAHALEPANSTYALALARILLAGDRAQESEALLRATQATGENEAQRLALLGVALAATHKIDEALSQLQKAVDQDPKLALAQNVLGFCYLQQGQYAKAAEAYGKASELEPRRSLYARDAALASERAGQNDQATRFAERASSLDDTSADAHALLGKLYAASGRNQQAVQELLRAATLNPDLDSACYLLARTYQRIGDREQAIAWSDKLNALKQKHEAEFALQKKVAATAIRSSTLLQGGSLESDQAGVP